MASRVRVLRVGGAGAGERADTVVVEEPLQVHVEHRGARVLLGSTMRTPGHDLDLAVGLAVGEGVVSRRSDVRSVRHCAPGGRGSLDNDVTVTLDDDIEVDLAGLGRVRHPSSACGVCGRDEIDALLQRVRAVPTGGGIDPELLASLPERMRERQSLFQRTGGLHAAALATAAGSIVSVREDVGPSQRRRQGRRRRAARPDAPPTCWSSADGPGFEIVQKAAMAGIAVVASVSAPTSLSVDVARECGITLASVRARGQAHGLLRGRAVVRSGTAGGRGMVRRAPRQDSRQDAPEVSAPKATSAGNAAVASIAGEIIGKLGVKRTALTLAARQPEGRLRLPGLRLARAGRDRARRRVLRERREGGRRGGDHRAASTPEFFAAHTVAELAERSPTTGSASRAGSPQPMVLRRGRRRTTSRSRWDEAFALIAERAAARWPRPDEAVFYTSGRTSNEAAFLYQLFARAVRHQQPARLLEHVPRVDAASR